MKDYKTTIIGICVAFIGILNLIVSAVQGKPIDLPTTVATVSALATALGLGLAADSTKPPGA